MTNSMEFTTDLGYKFQVYEEVDGLFDVVVTQPGGDPDRVFALTAGQAGVLALFLLSRIEGNA